MSAPPPRGLAEALEWSLGRPITDGELARAAVLGPRALAMLHADRGPVPLTVCPERALTVAALRMTARVLEGWPLAVTPYDRQALADDAAALRGPHPFLRGYGGGVPVFHW